jgi:hypothetical protein
MSDERNTTTTAYIVVYEVTGDREKHNEWWRMISGPMPDGIKVTKSASFDALEKLDEAEEEVTW